MAARIRSFALVLAFVPGLVAAASKAEAGAQRAPTKPRRAPKPVDRR